MAYNYASLKKYTKSQVNGLTKALSAARFGPGDRSETWQRVLDKAKYFGLQIGYCGPYSGERLDFIKPRKITREQTELGKAWLKDYFFKQDGTPRTGKRTEYVSNRVLSIAKSVVRFEFVGVAVLASQGFYPTKAVPIYRAFNCKGDYFDYSPVHWGEPIIDENN